MLHHTFAMRSIQPARLLPRLQGRLANVNRRAFSTSPRLGLLHSDPKPPIMSSEAAAAPFKKSTFRTKVRNPMVPLLIMVSLISSALIKIAASQQEYEVLVRTGETKKAALHAIIARLQAGEEFDVQKELTAVNSSDADKSLEDLIQEIEQAETEWMVTSPAAATPELKSEPVQLSSQPAAPTDTKSHSSKFL